MCTATGSSERRTRWHQQDLVPERPSWPEHNGFSDASRLVPKRPQNCNQLVDQSHEVQVRLRNQFHVCVPDLACQPICGPPPAPPTNGPPERRLIPQRRLKSSQVDGYRFVFANLAPTHPLQNLALQCEALHLKWRSPAPQAAKPCTSGCETLNLRLRSLAPPVWKPCTSGGETLHLWWRNLAPQVARPCTSGGETLHLRWRSLAPQVAKP